MATSTALKAAQMNAYTTVIGTGGKARFLSSGGAVLGVITFDTPAAPTTTTEVLTFSGFPKNATAVVAGTVASVDIVTSADVMVRDGLTVGLAGSGADVIMDSLTLASTLTVNSFTITHS